MSRNEISNGMGHLVILSGENSKAHGFHEDWPLEGYPTVTETGAPADHVSNEEISAHKQQVRRAIAEKLALIHEEVSEALGEIRSGHDPLDTYFADHKGKVGEVGSSFAGQVYAEGVPLLKPEGFLVELADAVIRIADLVYLVDGVQEFTDALEVKHEYNASREHKHGRRF
jgi:hypothetical protein